MMQALTQLINFLAEIVLPVRGEAALGKAEMGNAQRKFHSKGGGSKLEDRGTQKQKESTESGLKKRHRREKITEDRPRRWSQWLFKQQPNKWKPWSWPVLQIAWSRVPVSWCCPFDFASSSCCKTEKRRKRVI